MRQLQVLDEARRLHVVGVREHELLVLRRRRRLLPSSSAAQGAIDQRHGHRLALAVAEHQPVAARELRRGVRRALELVDHLAFGQGDAAERHGKAQLLRHQLDLDLAHADLAGEGMRAPVAALRGVAERQQEALVAARQRLQADVAAGGKRHGIARDVADRCAI